MESSIRQKLEGILNKIPAERKVKRDLLPRNMEEYFEKVNIIGNSRVGKTSFYSTFENGVFKNDI
jgi:hypothetical protein